jgi:hypothetical protein
LDAGKHLGENHQKLVIPAAYLKGGGHEKAAMRAAASYDGFGFLNTN